MEEQVNVPTFVTREQLPEIRIQLAQLNHYDALRALDEDITPNVSAMREEDINALSIYKYQVQSATYSSFGELLMLSFVLSTSALLSPLPIPTARCPSDFGLTVPLASQYTS